VKKRIKFDKFYLKLIVTKNRKIYIVLYQYIYKTLYEVID